MPPSETTPLLTEDTPDDYDNTPTDPRQGLFDFLEAKTPGGQHYERGIVLLIVLNVFTFILSSLFVEDYNDAEWAQRGVLCGDLCDALWFGNYRDNGLQVLRLGSTSVLELITIAVFTVEYILRLYTCDLESDRFRGVVGRWRYFWTFFSLVDLASTLPFYVDAFLLRDSDLAASAFLRMFRLLRMMRVEGRYDTALTMVDDVYHAQKAILGTALFVGVTTWITVASLYYLVERKSLDMIYCGASLLCGDMDIDTSLCSIDQWGMADCSDAGCPATAHEPEPCYNLYQSIPMASYYALLNLFGEFPLVDQHTMGGMLVGTITAVVAVAVFALPAGIIGNGFEAEIEKRRQVEEETPIVERGLRTEDFIADESTPRGRLYNFFHAQTKTGSVAFEFAVNALVLGTALTFMLDTLDGIPQSVRYAFDVFEFAAVLVFTADYVLHVYSAKEDPKYRDSVVPYVTGFLPMVDFLSVAPYWMEVLWMGTIFSPLGADSLGANLVKALRLLRILRFEKYTHAFTSFDDVISRNKDVLFVTMFTAILFWVFFGAFLYLTERDNPDPEMASNYNTVPNSMWMTLLNLSGEAPLAQYSAWGKVATGILGLFATGIFGIPIGILGAGFEQVVEEENEDNADELQVAPRSISQEALLGSSLEQMCYKFVNGIGSPVAKIFETCIYVLIFTAVAVGVIQTVEGHEHDLTYIEAMTIVVFTFEYVVRLIGAGADPEFAPGRNAVTARLRFIFSFYSIIDLLAIVPYYLTVALPGGIVDQYDEYLRMLRIIRLVKLDKYIPSITLIDDVIRLKFRALRVAFFAAVTLWILFAALLYIFEVHDHMDALDDPVPDYGCSENCDMSDRFQNFFDSMVYTGVHLTGDYPITEYTWPAKFVNFFMVIAAVGVVSIPSALVASGFVEIVQSKNKARRARERGGPSPPPPSGGMAGDDWYEHEYRALEGVDPPPSRWGPKVDEWQCKVNEFLNGREGIRGHEKYGFWALIGRIFIFSIIIANVLAVLLESVPAIDKAVGNEKGNFFDVFEALSVMVFATEYIARLFCAPKNREALYSSFIYATTFFGIVDFLSTAPWFVQQALLMTHTISPGDDVARIFRIFRIFRILQLEDFVTAFSKLDNVFRASKDVLKATGLMALIIWVGCAAVFFIFEENNPNWRHCDASIPLVGNETEVPGCYDFASTAECNAYYPGMCSQKVFVNMPNSLYLTAVFLGGEWGLIDFTPVGRVVCLFLCVVGIGLYAIPIGALFDSFGAILGMSEEEEDGDGDDC